MAMRTLKNSGRTSGKTAPARTGDWRPKDGRESRGPETVPSLERDADAHGRPVRERGKDFDDELIR